MPETKTIPPDVLELAEELGVGENIYAILDVTQEIFPGPVTLETGYDPSWPEGRWITFLVEDTGEFKEIIQRECHWHSRLREIIPGRMGVVCISVFPRQGTGYGHR